MVVNPSFPAKTVSEFVAYAKENPGKINMSSGGIGTSPHLAGELFKATAKVDFVHVPYSSSAQALTDLMGGVVQVMFDTLGSSIGLIKAGKLRALGVTTKARSAALPDVPTIAEVFPGFEVTSWTGIVAPANTPREIVARLGDEIASVLSDPKFVSRFAESGLTPMPLPPAEFGKFIVDEIEKWGKVIRVANIKPD